MILMILEFEEDKRRNEKLRKLLNEINEKKTMVQNLVEQGKLEEAKAAKEELVNLQKKFDLLKDVMDPEGDGIVAEPVNTVPAAEHKNSVKEFADAARKGFRNATMTEGTATNGGYTVPEDIQTRVNEYRSAKASLIDLVDIQNVTTNKGQRTFKKRAQQTGFTKVGEGGKISAGSTPEFERKAYEIEKYAGYFPVTNELLADSDENITETIIAWIGDESRVTRNKLIIEQIETKDVTEIKSADDIKTALNVTLGQAFKPTSKIITNDDGLNWLDTLKDNEGRYLLQPDPANPMQYRFCAGATIIPICVIPNADYPSDTKTAGNRKIPMTIGDLYEGITFWDRNLTTITTSNIAQVGSLNAFEEDLTIFRAIEREDCNVKDEEAFVRGQITIKDTTVKGS